MPAKHSFRGGGSLLFNQRKARSLSSAAKLPHHRCHRTAWPGDPVCRDVCDRSDRLRRTGFPAFAGN